MRTPWDHSLVDSSPRPFVASHVLHRLLVPRHPPFALGNLTTKMLASTVQFSNNDQPQPTTPAPPPPKGAVTNQDQEGTQRNTTNPATAGQCLFLQDPTGCLL